MEITNCIDLYDIYITEKISEKFTSVENKFLFSPTELCFSFAVEEFGENFFPLCNVWRVDIPKTTNDNTSLVNYNLNIQFNEDNIVNHLLLDFSYQIDYFSEDMREINKTIIDYYKFRSLPYINIDLSDLEFIIKDEFGNPYKYTAEVQFGDPQENNNVDQMFESGRYFRCSFPITTRLLIFDVKEKFKYDKINIKLGVYNKESIKYIT